MTVRNTNYSSLDEVWGDVPSKSTTSSKRRDKKDKRDKIEQPKVVDPICELYEMGNYRGYNENDIINYANEYHDKYLEKEYNKNYSDNFVHQQPSMSKTYTDEDEYEYEHTKPVLPKNETYRKKKIVHDEQETSDNNAHNEFAFIDLLLYIISGIILIFVMEQFVKIGLLLQ